MEKTINFVDEYHEPENISLINQLENIGLNLFSELNELSFQFNNKEMTNYETQNYLIVLQAKYAAFQDNIKQYKKQTKNNDADVLFEISNRIMIRNNKLTEKLQTLMARH